jgi:hypothetical protein
MVRRVYLGQNFELRKKKLEFLSFKHILIISNMNIPEKPSETLINGKDLIIGNTVCLL